MKKVFLFLLASFSLFSCGYSQEEQAQMQQESAAKTDSAADDIEAELGFHEADSANSEPTVEDSLKK